jgi:serine/threonine protein kinase
MIMQVRTGHYRIRERIGAGGMGTVYQAEDTRTGQVVALKVLHPHLAADSDYLKRFHREVRIARRLSSPNIVRLLDAGSDGSTHFLAMEYVDGQTLAQLLSSQGKLPVGQAVSFAMQIASALDEAHANGIIHRDISPQNILIDGVGTVKVADFGIARDTSETATIGTALLMGRPHYTSPDQWNGRADIRSDIYSLGVVLYQMLTGTVPFSDNTPLGTLRMHQERLPPPLRELRPEVSAELHGIVHKCLAKRPDDRYQVPSEIIAALDLGLPSRKAPLAPRAKAAAKRTHYLEPQPCKGCGRPVSRHQIKCNYCSEPVGMTDQLLLQRRARVPPMAPWYRPKPDVSPMSGEGEETRDIKSLRTVVLPRERDARRPKGSPDDPWPEGESRVCVCGEAVSPSNLFCPRCQIPDPYSVASGSEPLMDVLSCPRCTSRVTLENLHCPKCGLPDPGGAALSTSSGPLNDA